MIFAYLASSVIRSRRRGRLGQLDQQAVVDVRHARVALELPVEVVLEERGGLDVGAPDELLLGGQPTGFVVFNGSHFYETTP
ncbi:hypothetical protein STENM327S_08835 [Streptomyces tendae]